MLETTQLKSVTVPVGGGLIAEQKNTQVLSDLGVLVETTELESVTSRV